MYYLSYCTCHFYFYTMLILCVIHTCVYTLYAHLIYTHNIYTRVIHIRTYRGSLGAEYVYAVVVVDETPRGYDEQALGQFLNMFETDCNTFGVRLRNGGSVLNIAPHDLQPFFQKVLMLICLLIRIYIHIYGCYLS